MRRIDERGRPAPLELPVEPAERPERRGTAGRAEGEAVTTLKGITVLVAEDDADTRDLVKRLLEAQQASVVLAASASEALDVMATTRPDVLVSDIGLPDMDGYSLIKYIREKGGGRDIPAVALTAYARSEDRTKALRTGYQAHIPKPVEPGDLIAAIASFPGLARAREDPAPTDRRPTAADEG